MTASLAGAACPDAEEVASFVSGRLGAAPAEHLLAHMADCSPCRALLSALARGGGDDDPSAPTLPAATAAAPGAPDAELQAGARVGRYVVLGRLGAGGMGVVYAAHDPELDRKVALKLLRCDGPDAPDHGQLRDRLLREAQAMARLAHPHVVAVHDVGSHADQVFVAMELVEGQTLARWLAAAPRGWRDIVAAFVQAGQGLAAAHASGLQHRDFKPENVLVGSDGRVRVTDFGLARASGSVEAVAARAPVLASTPAAMLTRTGTLMGTPYYMAPEQLEGAATDARSDQFSFCVALHVALTGEHPFDLEGEGGLVAAVTRARLRERARFQALPRRLRSVLRRGLARAAQARYPSMAELLVALAHTPARRHWRVLVVAAVLLSGAAGALAYRGDERALLCTGAARKLAGVWDPDRAQVVARAFLATGKPYAAAAYVEVARVLDAYTRAWVAMHTDACEATRLRGEQPEEQLGLRMACLDGRLRELRALTDRFASADAELVERAPRVVHGLGDLAGCADAATLASPLRPPADASVRAQVAALRGELAEVKALAQAGRYREGCERARRLAAAAHDTAHRPLEAEVALELGQLENACGDDRAAQQALEQAVWAAEASRHDQVAARAWIALVRLDQGVKARYDEALALRPRVTAALERLGGDVELEGQLHVLVGRIFLDTSRYAEAQAEGERALALLEQRFGADDLRVAEAVALLGDVAFSRGGSAAAPYVERELAIKQKVYGPEHPEIARVLRSVSRVRYAQGRYAESCAVATRALAISEAALGPSHRVIASHLNDVAVCSIGLGDWERALAVLERALTIDAATVGRDHRTYAIHLMTRGIVQMAVERDREALASLEEALAVLERRLGAEDARVSTCRGLIARALHHLGREDEARAQALRAVEILEKVEGPEHPYLYEALLVLGQVDVRTGAARRALPVLERARRLADYPGIDASDRAEIDAALARALVDAHADRARARRLAQAAHAVLAGDRRRRKAYLELDRWLRAQGWGGGE